MRVGVLRLVGGVLVLAQLVGHGRLLSEVGGNDRSENLPQAIQYLAGGRGRVDGAGGSECCFRLKNKKT